MPSPLDKIVTGKRLGFVAEHTARNCGAREAMSILSVFRRAKPRYADDKALDHFTPVLETVKPSAFDVAMDETQKADADAWAKLEQDLKREG